MKNDKETVINNQSSSESSVEKMGKDDGNGAAKAAIQPNEQESRSSGTKQISDDERDVVHEPVDRALNQPSPGASGSDTAMPEQTPARRPTKQTVIEPRGVLEEPGSVAVTPGTTARPKTNAAAKPNAYKNAATKQKNTGVTSTRRQKSEDGRNVPSACLSSRQSSEASGPGAYAIAPRGSDNESSLQSNSDTILMRKQVQNLRRINRSQQVQASASARPSRGTSKRTRLENTKFSIAPVDESSASVHSEVIEDASLDVEQSVAPPRLLAEKYSLASRKRSRLTSASSEGVSSVTPGSFVSMNGVSRNVSTLSMDVGSSTRDMQSVQDSEPGAFEEPRPSYSSRISSLRSSLRSSFSRRPSLEQGGRQDSTLVNATLVQDEDDSPVYAAEAVPDERIQRRRRRMRVAGAMLISALITTIIIVTTRAGEGGGENNDPKCLIPLEEQNVTTQCACQGEISTIPPDALGFGDVMLNMLVNRGVLSSDFRENVNETSCLPENQALWWIADPSNVDITRESFTKVVSDPKFESQIIQRYVLGLLFLSMGGKHWARQTNWLSTAPVCTWFGLACTQASRLSLLELPANDLSGSIPIQIGDLFHLQSMNFAGNLRLTGTLPSEVSKIKGLRSLQIKNTGLSGQLPISLKENEILTSIILFNNSLTGVFPSEVAQLPLLQTFDIANNKFNGTLPTEIGNMQNLGVLGIDNNDFTGEIPSEIGQARSLQIIKATNNNFSGEIPAEMGNLIFLGDLELTGNSFSGTIPGTFTNLKRLSIMSVSTNLAEGSVPETLCETLESLEAIFLDCKNSTNSFCSCCSCKGSELAAF